MAMTGGVVISRKFPSHWSRTSEPVTNLPVNVALSSVDNDRGVRPNIVKAILLAVHGRVKVDPQVK